MKMKERKKKESPISNKDVTIENLLGGSSDEEDKRWKSDDEE